MMIRVDKKRCQAEKPKTSFMTMGGTIPSFERCSNVPTYVATEKTPPVGHKKCGKMSLCDNCKIVLIKQLGKDYATFTKI
jgi:hypothetical protein